MHLIPIHVRLYPKAVAFVAVTWAAAIGVTVYLMMRSRPTPEQLEERRRARLATHGRIIDGTLLDSAPRDDAPQALIYSYRIGGVEYECGQDISALAPQLRHLGPASGLFGTPIQVRYDRDNPADSIVIAETWNGLWNRNLAPVERDRERAL